MKYAGVVVDNNTNATDAVYTYRTDIPDIAVGQKVRVPFSVHDRMADGYIVSVSDDPPEGVSRFKNIASVCDDVRLTEEAVSTALWMRGRYLCRYIEAIKCFLPVSEVRGRSKDPFEGLEAEPSDPKELTVAQGKALKEISAALDARENRIFLLHGVTGSGKTEVYLQAMAKVADSGRQGIVLVPEISLTPQLVSRFMSRFGKDSVAVLHSRLTPVQRAVQYKRIESGEVKLVVGARSAIFAPLKDIGLIVMDEEHETSYKSDKSPKYDTLEIAEKRALWHRAPMILGSATPSIVDYSRSESGLFTRLELTERYNSNPLPRVEIVDMTAEIKAGNKGLFSRSLLEKMDSQLKAGRQIILFLNRRGYSSYVSCRECGHTMRCPECGITLTYHREEGALLCHYCGRKTPMPKVCPECGSRFFGGFGAGTEQVEEKVKELFPDAQTARLDLDTVNKKGSLESVLKKFGRGKINILIGTQIVAKGLDFANVGLVGVISADVSLNIPDFRSAERTFQLVTQVAGRSGRGDEPGSVVVQTNDPENAALVLAASHDYKGFYRREIGIRKAAGYPPFSDIYQIVVADEDEELAYSSAKRCAVWLRRKLEGKAAVLGPAPGVLVKGNGMYRFQVLIKSPAGSRKDTSRTVRELKEVFAGAKDVAQLLTVDINPYSFI
ncbi:MAG: primosomal protein N' [Firmicutes bacterium]|nr:primosomal protein N' [Bacillota bacterium]